MRPLSAIEKGRLDTAAARSAAPDDRRMRLVAIALMCAAMVLFTGLDTSTKWLGRVLPISEIVWARYVGATVFALIAARPWVHPRALLSNRPGLQTLRSLALLGSTVFGMIALRSLQLAETATISFLLPIFVALAAGPLLGERVGRERMIAIIVGFIGVLIATRPGTSAFRPVVGIAIVGVMCNAGYFLATRKLAGIDSPEATMIWTQLAGVVLATPLLFWTWQTPHSVLVWAVMAGLGLFGAAGHGLVILAHKYAPAPVLTPFSYTQLVWMIMSGFVVFGDVPPVATLVGASLVVACGAWLALKERAGRRPDVA